MKERRRYQRRVLSDRRWGGERRRRERRAPETVADPIRLERQRKGLPERRATVRRSGIERRVIRGRVLHDRRTQSGQHAVPGDDVRASLDDNPRQRRPVLRVSSRSRTRSSRRRRRRLLLSAFGLAVLAVVLLVVSRMI